MIIAKKVWKQLVWAYFRVLFWHMPGGNEETYENLDQNGDCPDQGLNSGTPNMNQNCILLKVHACNCYKIM
jgi:hypothetical protein